MTIPPRSDSISGVHGLWLSTPDVDGSSQFYSGLTAGYPLVRDAPSAHPYPRVTLVASDGPGARWLVGFGAVRVEDVVGRCLSAGARVVNTVEELSVMSVADPRGVVFGLVHGTPDRDGARLREGDVVLADLYTRNVDGESRFYSAAFGVEPTVLSDDPVDYVQLNSGGRHVAGLLEMSTFLAPGTDEHWMPYLYFRDVAAGVARASALGGLVVIPATASPTGTYAVVKDPLGCLFGLWDGTSLNVGPRRAPAVSQRGR